MDQAMSDQSDESEDSRSREASMSEDPTTLPETSRETTPNPASSTISDENLREAEDLLPKMNFSALKKLKGLLRDKADSVKRDLAILTRHEQKLLKVSGTLEEELAKFMEKKKRIAETLTRMRDNLCKIPGFNCKTFELRGEAVVRDTVRDQWLAKGEMLETMEELIQKGTKEDKEISNDLAVNEEEWRRLFREYLQVEERLVSGQRRLEDLRGQSKNYADLVKRLESKLSRYILLIVCKPLFVQVRFDFSMRRKSCDDSSRRIEGSNWRDGIEGNRFLDLFWSFWKNFWTQKKCCQSGFGGKGQGSGATR